MKIKSIKIIDQETNEPVGIELVSQQIEKIHEAICKIEKTRATRKLIVALIHDDTKIGKAQIETILDSYESLDRRYLKGRKIK